MRTVAGALRLLAHTAGSVDYRRFFGSQHQIDIEAIRDSCHGLLLEILGPAALPVAVPNAPIAPVCSGQSRTRAVEALGMKEAASVDIAEGEMREPHIADVPYRGGVVRAVNTLAEECQFKAE